PNLRDNDILFEFYNLRKRLDWGFTYYRGIAEAAFPDPNNATSSTPIFYPGKTYSNYYLARLRYPLDRVRSIRATIGPRFDRLLATSSGAYLFNNNNIFKYPDIKKTYGQLSLEYVYDNAISPATNIWHGLRYKIYGDL